ncbi:flagellar biosynthesis anti-sigma factor FlgM [Amantichitinum ursilacus]|uniref:Negative regulator of flagellin synthesis n=1 Tax=Amantichitinum ursilacus TaxID=857265 RepID=A0A0N0XIP9_9NEIS|nr:flagellar biosynthesis anti-sigma factor FlgM [Amantichitinum ursilacus]KPC52941.1 anti-sigma28 factor FlgM [Amantichitinum ursilacus]
MKIDQTGKVSLQTPTRSTDRTATPATQTDAGEVSSARDDSVTINPAAAQLGQVDQANDTSVFDSDRVAQLRQAIADGKFTVRSDAIADKLIDSVKQLLSQ